MLRGIQYLRGFAALLVVLHHAQYWQQTFGNGHFKLGITFGLSGVDIFFVISGFIMFYVTEKNPYTPQQFIRARLIRIVPNYWLYLALFVAIHPETTNAAHVVKSFLFIPAYHPDFKPSPSTIWPPLLQGWTLNYEMFFYGLFAFGLWTGHRIVFMSILLPSLVILGEVISPTSAIMITYTSPLLIEFLFGALLARLYFLNFHPTLWVGITLLIIGIILLPVLSIFPVPEIFADVWVVNRGLPALFLVSGVLMIEKADKMPSSQWLLLLGASSYTLYLSHVFVLEAWVTVWGWFGLVRYPDVLLLLTSLVASVAVGIALYLLVELPMLSVLRRRSRPASSILKFSGRRFQR